MWIVWSPVIKRKRFEWTVGDYAFQQTWTRRGGAQAYSSQDKTKGELIKLFYLDLTNISQKWTPPLGYADIRFSSSDSGALRPFPHHQALAGTECQRLCRHLAFMSEFGLIAGIFFPQVVAGI